MESLNQKPIGVHNRPVQITVNMGDWEPHDHYLKMILSELPYPAFRFFINESYLPMLEEIIKRSISKSSYKQAQDQAIEWKRTHGD